MNNNKIKHKTNKYNMSVEQAYKILTDKSMAQVKCNFKIQTKGGKTKYPRNNKPPKWFLEFQNQMLDFVKRQEQFNQYVLDVFKRNNLFQQHVEDVFKRNNLK